MRDFVLVTSCIRLPPPYMSVSERLSVRMTLIILKRSKKSMFSSFLSFMDIFDSTHSDSPGCMLSKFCITASSSASSPLLLKP